MLIAGFDPLSLAPSVCRNVFLATPVRHSAVGTCSNDRRTQVGFASLSGFPMAFIVEVIIMHAAGVGAYQEPGKPQRHTHSIVVALHEIFRACSD